MDAYTTVTLPNKGQVSTGDHPPPGMHKKANIKIMKYPLSSSQEASYFGKSILEILDISF